MIAVLDSNTPVSMAAARLGGTLATILASWRAGLLSVILPQHIYSELTRVLADPYFTSRLSAADTAEYLRFVRTRHVSRPAPSRFLGLPPTPRMTSC